MKILAYDLPMPGASQDKVMPYVVDESAVVWDLHAKGIIREMYFRTDHPGAVFMLECASIDEARLALDSLPLVKAGLIQFEFVPLGPFVPLQVLWGKPPM